MFFVASGKTECQEDSHIFTCSSKIVHSTVYDILLISSAACTQSEIPSLRLLGKKPCRNSDGAENAMGTVQKREQELGWGWNILTRILLKVFPLLHSGVREGCSFSAGLPTPCLPTALPVLPSTVTPNTGKIQSHHTLCYCHAVLIFMAMSWTTPLLLIYRSHCKFPHLLLLRASWRGAGTAPDDPLRVSCDKAVTASGGKGKYKAPKEFEAGAVRARSLVKVYCGILVLKNRTELATS